MTDSQARRFARDWRVVGTPFNDTATLDGGPGNDYLNGGSGADLLLGGAGNDFIAFGDDSDLDFLTTGIPHDWTAAAGTWSWSRGDLAYSGTSDRLILPVDMRIEGRTAWFKDSGNDTTEADTAFGGEGDDLVAGNEGSDFLAGEAGDDALKGNGGDDVLEGGTGADLLVGDDGADTLDGGADNDRLYGGYEADTRVTRKVSLISTAKRLSMACRKQGHYHMLKATRLTRPANGEERRAA